MATGQQALPMDDLAPCGGGCGALTRRGYRGLGIRCPDCRKDAARQRQRTYRQRRKARGGTRPFLKEQHSMTEADLQAMRDAQDNRCAGCGESPPFAGGKDLHIDHDHRCCPNGGRSCAACRRGLLCPNCNMGLGLLGDDPARLEALAAYVRQWEGGG